MSAHTRIAEEGRMRRGEVSFSKNENVLMMMMMVVTFGENRARLGSPTAILMKTIQ